MQFFAYVQMHDMELVRLDDLQDDFRISARQERELLAYLAKKGSIIRLKRGVYVVPKHVPPGGKWQPDPKYLISCLMEVMSAHYYIGGQYAFNYHELTEQIPNMVTVYNDKLSGGKTLGVLSVQFIKVATGQIGNPIAIELDNSRLGYIASLERCIVDAVADYSRYSTLPKAYRWIREHINQPGFLKTLVNTTTDYGNISTKRRIGFIVDPKNWTGE